MQPPVVCRRTHVLFILFVCVCLHILLSNTYCTGFLFCFSSSCVTCVASFSGLSIHSWLSLRYSLTFIYNVELFCFNDLLHRKSSLYFFVIRFNKYSMSRIATDLRKFITYELNISTILWLSHDLPLVIITRD